MKIGKMARLLTLEAQGAAGAWAQGVSFYAAVENYGDAQNATANDKATHRIITRYRADVQTGMRLTESSRAWRVRAVRDADQMQRWIEIIAEEEKLLWG